MFRSSALHLYHLIRGHHSVVQVVHDPVVGKNRVINRLQVVTVYSPNGNPPVHERDDGSMARASPALGVLPLPHTCARSGDSASGPRTVTTSTGMCTRSCVKTQLSDCVKKVTAKRISGVSAGTENISRGRIFMIDCNGREIIVSARHAGGTTFLVVRLCSTVQQRSPTRVASNKTQVKQPAAGGRQAGPQGAQHLGIWPGGFELVASTRALALSTTCSRPGCCRGGRLVLSFSIP